MRHLCNLLLALVLMACAAPAAPVSTPPTRTPVVRVIERPADPGQLVPPQTPVPAAVPLLAARRTQIAQALQRPNPILLLTGLDNMQADAQTLAVNDARVQQALRTADGRPMLAEVFGVYPLGPADAPLGGEPCRAGACLRVEIYNFALNATLLVAVDPQAGAVHEVQTLENTQPTIVPRHLMDLAAQIALAAPAVRAELGLPPDAAMIQQPQMKVQFRASACERARHLCVAPIFVWGERALWVIVDLVDATIIGLRWTDLGESSRRALTEQRLQDEIVTARFCEQATSLVQDDWSLNYLLTNSDGLRISEVQFRGRPVIQSAKLVDIHINYAQREGFGYSDALGCPAFSAAAVTAWDGPQIELLADGFALVQRFRSEFWPTPCNYAYRQRYEFYNDGRFRMVFVSEGRGCGNDAVYRPIMRIALAETTTGFAEWDGTAWQAWPAEGWQFQRPDAAVSPAGFSYRVGGDNGWYLAPDIRVGDGGPAEGAYIYVSHASPGRDEGVSDLPTLGECCNDDERQGPERFLDPPEPLADAPLVLWYVPQLRNSDTPGAEACWADAVLQEGVFVPRVWPCDAGLLFVPTSTP